MLPVRQGCQYALYYQYCSHINSYEGQGRCVARKQQCMCGGKYGAEGCNRLKFAESMSPSSRIQHALLGKLTIWMLQQLLQHLHQEPQQQHNIVLLAGVKAVDC